MPKRRCGDPPSLCARLVTATGSRVRLSAFEENRSQPLCTGLHPERMRPHPRLLLRELLSCSERFLEAPGSGKTSRAISAKSAVLAPAARIFRPPPPTPVSYAGRAACGAVSGSETSDLPWAAAHRVRLHRTPRIEIDQSDFQIIRRIFSPRNPAAWSAGHTPRDRASQPISLHSRPLGASWRLRHAWGEIAARSGSFD